MSILEFAFLNKDLGTADLLPMARTIMDLLDMTDGHDVALILGEHYTTKNRHAIAYWINEYLKENPLEQDFTLHIFPRFTRHYRQKREDLVQSIREWE